MWRPDNSLTYFKKICVNIIKAGQIPQHIAIIMDGNRRFAAKSNIKKNEGHMRGFDKLTETLQWGLDLGIKEITVYAFSIENFKRSEEEVGYLMNLAKEKFKQLYEEREKLKSDGIRVRVIGNLALLPKDIAKQMAETMIITQDNNKITLNIAVAYTSKNELRTAVKDVIQGVEENLISVDDINEDLISNCLLSNHMSDPDLLVRTSGEVRFSDFLLWQIWNTNICFTETFWPNLSIWAFLACMFQYQRCYKDIQKYQKTKTEYSAKVKDFLRHLNEARMAKIELYAKA